MNETLKFLKSSIRNKNLLTEDDRKLIEFYQKTKDDQIIAVIYCKYYPSIVLKESKKLLIDSDTRTSIILETIQRCLERFNLDAQNKFNTYLLDAIDYNLWTYISCYLKHKGRDRYTVSTDALNELGISLSTKDSIQKDRDEFEKIEFLTSLRRFKLSEKELQYCELIALSPSITITEVAEELHMQRVSVYYLRDRLKIKLADLFKEF